LWAGAAMKRHFISIDDLSNDEIQALFACADEMADLLAKREPCALLAGRIMATLFYEPSTRTRLSFESAMHRLGGGVISVPDASTSSAAKGESLADTARVMGPYADVVVIRHPADGAARVLADYADVPVINAGDGAHEHPTQTLLDLYTLRKEKGRIQGLTVALCGDLRHGRTIHSLAAALVRFGAELIFLPGRDLEMPDHLSRRLALRYGCRLRRARLSGMRFLVDRLDALYLTPRETPEDFAFSEEATLRELEHNQLVVFRYSTPAGEIVDDEETNPNGALANIAGISNPERNVLGLMPHPERASEPLMGSNDGRILFQSVIESLVAK